ncbi:MAG TPA: hypothetical protein VMR86_15285 [Myxococcota bacterium]|nr:hypothetical protein [Myxococcota bacterium]
MPRALRWLAAAAAAAIAVIVLGLVAARCHDGPLGPFTGGTFRSGIESPPPSDWSFAAARYSFELELPPAEGRSVTTGFMVVDGRLYVPSVLAEHKRWPAEVLADGRVRVRLDGRIYAFQATRVLDPPTLARVAPVFHDKYGTPAEGVGTRDWIFALVPR